MNKYTIKKNILITICFLFMICIQGCAGHNEVQPESQVNNVNENEHMNLQYATEFAVDYKEDGYALIYIDNDVYILIPEGKDEPQWISEDMIVVRQPLNNLYVAASSSLDLFDSIGGLNRVTMTSTKYNDWSLDSVRNAMDASDMEYVGKYSAPDYEYVLSCDCELAIESTMIYHSPETKEQLELLGIPVLVERSSYESHPLGRLEWVKLYGLLLGKEDEAEVFFNSKIEELNVALEEVNRVEASSEERPTVVFFYIANNGYAVVRRPGDYITSMIDMAGGSYAFDAIQDEDNNTSTINMQIEAFYEGAIDADILIYNSTIDGGIDNIDELISKCPVLADCKAVKEGNVWCTSGSVFQKSAGLADMLIELIYIINGQDKELLYFSRME